MIICGQWVFKGLLVCHSYLVFMPVSAASRTTINTTSYLVLSKNIFFVISVFLSSKLYLHNCRVITGSEIITSHAGQCS